MMVNIRIQVFWDVMLYSLAETAELQNTGTHLPHYMTPQPRRSYSLQENITWPNSGEIGSVLSLPNHLLF